MDGWPGKTQIGSSQRSGIGFFILPIVLMIALLLLGIIVPASSNWVAEAVQAEFPDLSAAPEPSPRQLARPDLQIRTVRAN